jgi:hypothetical protein
MLDLTKQHDSQNCNLGTDGPCQMCKWANSVEAQRGYAEWSLETEMNNFSQRYGSEVLLQKIDSYMTERGLY